MTPLNKFCGHPKCAMKALGNLWLMGILSTCMNEENQACRNNCKSGWNFQFGLAYENIYTLY